jgi:hypothetical protein
MEMVLMGVAFPGIDGFLNTRASFMLDVAFVAMFAVLPVLGWSIYLVKYERRFQLHKRMQLGLAVVLLITVLCFEIDLRFLTDWRKRAEPSPYSGSGGWVDRSLWIHLFFSISTTLLWIYVTVQALRKFPHPIRPNAYSPSHIFWAKLAAVDMLMTAITGWIFYWLAFVA